MNVKELEMLYIELKKQVTENTEDIQDNKERLNELEDLTDGYERTAEEQSSNFKMYLQAVLFVPVIRRAECYKLYQKYCTVNKQEIVKDKTFYKTMRELSWVHEDNSRNFRFDFGEVK